MPSPARLFTSVPAAQRERFAKLAAARGLSVSNLLARLVHDSLTETPHTQTQRLIYETTGGSTPAEKYTVRLTGADAAVLEKRAHSRGLTPSGYIAHLLRAHVRSSAPMPYTEFQELKRVVAELSGIRAAMVEVTTDRTRVYSIEPVLKENVLKLLPPLKAIREQVHAVLLANSKSWETEHG